MRTVVVTLALMLPLSLSGCLGDGNDVESTAVSAVEAALQGGDDYLASEDMAGGPPGEIVVEVIDFSASESAVTEQGDEQATVDVEFEARVRATPSREFRRTAWADLDVTGDIAGSARVDVQDYGDFSEAVAVEFADDAFADLPLSATPAEDPHAAAEEAVGALFTLDHRDRGAFRTEQPVPHLQPTAPRFAAVADLLGGYFCPANFNRFPARSANIERVEVQQASGPSPGLAPWFEAAKFVGTASVSGTYSCPGGLFQRASTAHKDMSVDVAIEFVRTGLDPEARWYVGRFVGRNHADSGPATAPDSRARAKSIADMSFAYVPREFWTGEEDFLETSQ